MRSMAGINRLEWENYWCPDCEEMRDLDSVKASWTCPECDQPIVVRAKSADGRQLVCIIRKRASELVMGDLFLMPGALDKESYEVVGITRLKDKLGVGLRQYGQYKIDPAEGVNCRVGTWVET